MPALIFIVAGIIMVFAFLYYRLSLVSQGLLTNPPTTQISFRDSIYFSIVTITTLGYGDFLPQGLSKALACVEVFLGLTMMGLIVAKLTSKRLSYHVRRLFSADAQRRLEGYAADFQRLQEIFVALTTKIGSAFAETPGGAPGSQREDCRIKLSETLFEFYSTSSRFRNYITYEVGQGDFFADAPVETLQKTADSVAQSLFAVQQMILSLTILARNMLLNSDNQRRITEALDRHKEVSTLANSHSKSEELRRAFQQLAETCRSIPEGYFVIVPAIVGERKQPDLVPGPSEPQDPTHNDGPAAEAG